MNYREPTPGELLAALKRDDSPSAADRERLRSRVLATLGTGALGVGGASLTSKAAVAAPKTALALGPLSKLSLVLGLVGTGAVFTLQPWGSAPEALRAAIAVNPPDANSVPALPAVSAGPMPELASPATVEDPSRTTLAAEASPALPKSNAPRARPGATDLDREISLLRAAQQALQAGRYPEALAKLSEHAQRFPRGLLRNEREASRAIALCQGGQSSSGQSRARDYLRANAQSPLAARVQSACKLD